MLTLKLDFLVAVIHSASFISNFVTELPIQRGIDQCSVAWTGIISVGIPDNRIQSDLELKVFNPTGDERLKFPWNQRRRTVLIPSWFMNIFSLCFRSYSFVMYSFSLCFFVIHCNSVARNKTCCSGISPARQPQLLFQSITRSAADRPNRIHFERDDRWFQRDSRTLGI